MNAPQVEVVLKLSGSATSTARALERLIGDSFSQGEELLALFRCHLSGRRTASGNPAATDALSLVRNHPDISIRLHWQDEDRLLAGQMGGDFRLDEDDRSVTVANSLTGAEIQLFKAKVGESRQKRHFTLFRGTPEHVLLLLPRLWTVKNCFWRTSGQFQPGVGKTVVPSIRSLPEG